MADIGRILYLPSPQTGALPGRGNTAGADARGVVQSDGAGIGTATDESANADSAQGRARHFRFRVYDGGRADTPLAGDSGVPARRSEGEAAGENSTAGIRQQSLGVNPAAGRSGSGNLTAASAPFLAQLIAQEQLRPGLYDPPLKAADRAYRQAGGEPALTDGAARARFQIAV